MTLNKKENGAVATVVQEQPAKLSFREKGMLLRGALSIEYFRDRTRPMLYNKSGGDPERVHELVLDTLHASGRFSSIITAPFFKPPKNLIIKINGKKILPIGTSAGMDKNGDALWAFSSIYGFQEPGTVILSQREGNKRVRMALIENSFDLINAQGFPSKGLEYFIGNLSEYRNKGGNAPIYVSVCGLPISEENAVKKAMEDMETLVKELNPYVDGFVWNPFSPNTSALKLLREPLIFKETAALIADLAHNKLRLVKMGPYEPEDKGISLELVGAFMWLLNI